ncbi:MAG: VanZ family protein [Oscillospiraceae bacterium]|nr:VanZ family protein [Oscillospiraceae bacterium]
MYTQDLMQLALIAILLLCGYLYLLQIVTRRTENAVALPVIAVILLIIYLFIAIPLVFILQRLGSAGQVLLALLLLFACAFLFAAVYGLYRNFREINKGMLALFLVYTLAIGYVTIFSRDGKNDTSIFLFRFDAFEKAIRTRSLEPIYDILLNVALFVPMGFLMPFVLPEKLDKWSYALMTGLMFTTVIEATQMLLRLGQADLTDIVTNALGAVIGFFFYRLTRRFYPQPSEEEEL